MKRLPALKWHRLLIALGVTFIVADTYPHPNLPPGLIHTAIASVTETTTDTWAAFFANREDEQKAHPGIAQRGY